MERIQALITKLNEQFSQNADPAQILVTVQLLHHELSQIQDSRPQRLGTAKVAVVMPGSMNTWAAPVADPIYEKYAPRPVEHAVLVETKEQILVSPNPQPAVKKNGQLDMTFDPMNETPTLSHQAREVNDSTISPESLNDKLKQGRAELSETLKESPIKDLRKAIGINDRFLFINDLFRGDESMYERSIRTINSFNIYPEAEYWINREMKVKLGWDNTHSTVQHFDQLVKRRFS